MDAGANIVLDIVAGKVIERSGIPLLVLDGRDPENLYRAIVEGAFVGTVVCEEGSTPPCSPEPLLHRQLFLSGFPTYAGTGGAVG